MTKMKQKISWPQVTQHLHNILVLAPNIGIANTLAASIAGTLIVSVAFDHFGLIGLPVQPVNATRIVGCVGMLISLVLIQRG